MKKTLIASLLCVVLLLTACTSQQEKLEKDANKIAALFDSASQPFFGNKEEYDAFMAKNGAKLPGSFITWEEVSVFGEFNSLVMLGGGCYLYGLVDDAGCEINIEIDPNPQLAEIMIISLDAVTINSSGFRDVTYDYDGNVDFVLQRNGVEYSYDRGSKELSYIVFYINGVKVLVTGDHGLSEYPNRTDTMIGKLLSADDATAKAAITEINRKLG